MRLARYVVPLLALLPLTTSAAPQSALNVELHEWQLPNGLRVLYSPQRRVPAVTVQIWYHVGSKNEHPGVRGIAHMFEHMMFKGSEHVPPQEHARLISQVGGNMNGFTSDDVTAYYETVPKQYFSFALQLEAERMRYLHLTPETVQSEREVVKEEKRMAHESNPIGRASEAIRALAYTKHPYAWTPAGTLADLNQIEMAACQQFYNTYYVPNNATLIVVGDVSKEEARREIERHFGGLARGKTPPPVALEEPPQLTRRAQQADWPAQLRVVIGAYHIPASAHPDMPALEVLGAILSAGRSSRLNQALVRREKLAVAAGGSVSRQEHPGLLLIYGIGLPSHDAAKIEAALLRELERISQTGVTPEELLKARNQLATSRLESIETLAGLASAIGRSTYLDGDPRRFLTAVTRLDQVTAADVQRVAKTYLGRDQLSIVVMDRIAGAAQQGGGQ